MAAIGGHSASFLTATASSDLDTLFDAIKQYRAGITVQGGTADTTGGASATVMTKTSLLRKASWSCEGYYPTAAPSTGLKGTITFASGTVFNVTDYTLTITAQELDTTGKDASHAGWSTCIPGLVSATLAWNGYVDGSAEVTELVAPNATPASATIALTDTANDNFTATILTVQRSVEAQIGQTQTYSYSADVSGSLSAGSATLWPSGALTLPATGVTITHTKQSGSTEAGTGFWTNIAIRSPVNGPIIVSASGPISGAVTIA